MLHVVPLDKQISPFGNDHAGQGKAGKRELFASQIPHVSRMARWRGGKVSFVPLGDIGARGTVG